MSSKLCDILLDPFKGISKILLPFKQNTKDHLEALLRAEGFLDIIDADSPTKRKVGRRDEKNSMMNRAW